MNLVQSGHNYVRDIDPADELRILRIRAGERELIVTSNKEFSIICVQKWNSVASNV